MTRPFRPEPATPGREGAWYRQPVLWLGALVFAASLGGCIWMVVLAMQHPDVPTHTPRHTVMGVPVGAPAERASTP